MIEKSFQEAITSVCNVLKRSMLTGAVHVELSFKKCYYPTEDLRRKMTSLSRNDL